MQWDYKYMCRSGVEYVKRMFGTVFMITAAGLWENLQRPDQIKTFKKSRFESVLGRSKALAQKL